MTRKFTITCAGPDCGESFTGNVGEHMFAVQLGWRRFIDAGASHWLCPNCSALNADGRMANPFHTDNGQKRATK